MRVGLWFWLGLLLLASPARANVPSAFSVQGVLRDNTGKLQSMMVNVSVSLFDAPALGNKIAGPYGPTAVMATNGLFTLPISDANLQTELGGAAQVWLEVTIGNDTFARQQVMPQLFALMCGTANGFSGSLLAVGAPLPATPTAITLSSPSQSSELDIGQSATNRMRVGWHYDQVPANAFGSLSVADGTNPLALQAEGGSVGIGTTTPKATLDVKGRENLFQVRIEPGSNLTGSFLQFDATNLLGGRVWNVFATGGTAMEGQGKFIIQDFTESPGRPVIVADASGNVGIGTASPAATLDLIGNTDFPHIRIRPGKNPNGTFMRFDATSLRGGGDWYVFTTGGGAAEGQGKFVIEDYSVPPGRPVIVADSSGNVGIGTVNPQFALDVNGQVHAQNVATTSDVRLKTDVETIDHALAKVAELRGVRFKWRNGGKRSVGVVAQELEKVYPELVSTAADGTKSIEYGNLSGVLIEAVKELRSENRALRARLDRIEARRYQRAVH